MIEITPEIRAFIDKNQQEDIRRLALKKHYLNCQDMPFVWAQIAGRQIAAAKLPTWAKNKDILYPRHLSMEQCSSELTAHYKAELIAQSTQTDTLADLTAGFGVDFCCMAQQVKNADYIERQQELCEIAHHNFPQLGLTHATIHNQDGIAYLHQMEPVDWLFLDPARRDEHGGKTVLISECDPDVCALEQELLQKGRHVMIKLSPMLDIVQAMHELKSIREIHVISVDNECKELLLILQKKDTDNQEECRIHCVNLLSRGGMQKFSFSPEEEASSEVHFCDELGLFLYEPNTSILKAGAFKSLSERFHLKKLHPNSQLYTSEQWTEQFPGRSFHIEGLTTFGKKELKDFLKEIPKANLTVRNFPQSVQELRKRLKLAEGGDIYLFATTLHDARKVLIKCKKA